jgi:hypothetical protein
MEQRCQDDAVYKQEQQWQPGLRPMLAKSLLLAHADYMSSINSATDDLDPEIIAAARARRSRER